MFAHRLKVLIPESHEVLLRLPSDVPTGEAEVIVLAGAEARETADRSVEEWLDALVQDVPPSPVIPLGALRREHLYE
ncbi:MAG: hypothetical protein FJ104_08635 [Deltaproteobacteria bacterium]|nr:hypothetical protein [Deltaproteobacteria bacterium]